MSNFLVAPAWLSGRLGQPGLKIVDGSWYLPAQARDAKAEFFAGHIPGAVFFDIDAIADRSTDLPHMLPDESAFAAAAGALGIAETDRIVVYDGAGLFSAARVWWTFRVFGAENVSILDGGLPAWKAAGHPLVSGEAHPEPARFRAIHHRGMVRDIAAVQSLLKGGAESIVDARSAERFRGEAPEPRPGISSGHMPGARNLPFDRLLENGRLVRPERIRALFEEAGVNLARPITTTCGSGVTAAVLAFALANIGKDDVSLYDGSWAEWAARPDAPIATGPA